MKLRFRLGGRCPNSGGPIRDSCSPLRLWNRLPRGEVSPRSRGTASPRTSDTPKPEISSYAPQVACWATGVAVHALVSHPIILFPGRRRHHLQGAATIQVPCASPAPPRPHFSHFHSRPLIRNHRRYPPDLPACARRLYGTKCAEGRAAGGAVEHAEGGRAMQLLPTLQVPPIQRGGSWLAQPGAGRVKRGERKALSHYLIR